MYTRITIAISILTLSGCSSYEPKPHITLMESNSFISNTSSLSNTYVHDSTSKLIVCAQPFPDTAFNQSEESNITISLVSQGGTESDSDGNEEGSGETELAGRTPTVLITRELFFRLCELSRNYGMTKDDVISLYNKTLDIVEGAWEKEASRTTVTIGDALQTTNTESISSTQTESMSDSVSNTQSDSTSNAKTDNESNAKTDNVSNTQSDSTSNAKTDNVSNTQSDSTSNAKTDNESNAKTDNITEDADAKNQEKEATADAENQGDGALAE